MLISIEHELPTLAPRGEVAVLPEVFQNLWQELRVEGWTGEGNQAVSRRGSYYYSEAQNPLQVVTTDTGPTVELIPSPAEMVGEIDQQMQKLRTLVGQKLLKRGIGLLGSGIHPQLGTSCEEYYRYRTPRMAYDYAVQVRGWHHWTLLNVAAMQEVVDVPVGQAPSLLAMMHRLAGVILFLNRNDPQLGVVKGRAALSVRPEAWRAHVPKTGTFAADQHKVYLPKQEIRTWRGYLQLLWERNPMFMLGTKTSGLVYLQEHPTFISFLETTMPEGWRGCRLDGGEEVRVVPEMVHATQTDWTYMGFARLRLFWKEGTSLPELVEAYRSDDETLEAFLAAHLQKVLLENRSSASPPPGDEMCSLAFVVGLLKNFDAVQRFLQSKPYLFWLTLARAAEFLPMGSVVQGVSVPQLLAEVLALSREGLRQRGCGEEQYLEPLLQRVIDQQSPAEHMLKTYRLGGVDAVVENLLYRFTN